MFLNKLILPVYPSHYQHTNSPLYHGNLSLSHHYTDHHHLLTGVLGQNLQKNKMTAQTRILCLLLHVILCTLVLGSKDLRGNPKPRVSPDRTGPDRTGLDRNRSGVGEHFKEYFRVRAGRGILFRVFFLPGYGTFSPGILAINLPFIPKLRK